MTSQFSALRLSGSAIALIASLVMVAPAMAQSAGPATAASPEVPPAAGTGQTESPAAEAPSAAEEGADIIVTGSSIRGVAPVGSNLVAVGEAALLKTAATSVTELVNTVPAITTAGSTPQAQSAFSYYAPQIHSLAGSGSNTTLALIDGLRMPGGGLQYAQTDPNIIPTPALQRVEVLADGASSIYGSDAVAGVVNFITKKRFDGLQVNGRVGFAKDYRSYDLNGIWGTTWDTGGVYVAGQFLKQQEITNDKRSFLSRGDYRDIGGSNTNTYNCSPATIRATSSSTVIYPNADTATPIPNNQTANGFCNNSIYGTAVPGVQREGVLVVINNEFSDRLEFTGKLVYNHLKHYSRGTPGTVNNAAVFGPGSNRGTQINPFFRTPPGTAFTQESINYVALTPDGDYGTNNYENSTFYVTSKFDYKISDSWTATLSGDIARSNSFQRGRNVFCSVCTNLALNGSPNLGGSTTVALPGGQTATVSQPLTTANALDIWNPLASSRTAASVYDYLYSVNTNNEHQNNMYQGKFEVQGALFNLPGGAVRMAAGAEYMHLTQDVYGLTPNSTGNGYANFISNLGPRNVKSGYLELYIPVVGEDMEVPLVQRFDLSISGRIDHYSDFGSTKNPKIAANWVINDSIKLRGNYAESFVAPPLNQVGDPRQGFIRGATGTGTSAVLDVPVSAYPEVRNLPGCETVTTVCRVGAGTGREGLDRSLGAGFAGVVPQTGSSWSVGVDFTPTFMPGFTANVTYWANIFNGGVASPAQPLIVNSAALRNRLTICAATGCTAAQIAEFTNVANGATVAPTLPANPLFLINRDVGNVLNLHVQGIDAQFQYRVPTASMGTFTIGATLTYFTQFDQDFGDAAFSILNTSGYNSQFPSIQTKGRGQLSWELDSFALDIFANYTGKYRNWIQTSVIPVQLGANGNPVGGGDRVRSDLTFDLHAAYNFNGGFMNGSQVYIDVKNVFDRNPPFYNGNVGGAGVGAWGFNAFTSNLLGRLVSVGFRANF
jgi:iron complex outermembrane recepter protein